MRRVVLSVFILFTFSLCASSSMGQKSRGSDLKQQPRLVKESTRFVNIAAYSDGKGVWLTWQMDVEVANIGFNVYRISSRGSELLTPVRMIPGAALHAREIPQYGETYNFYDEEGSGGAYYVETLSLGGSKIVTPTVTPQYVPSLKAFTGLSVDEMRVRGGFLRPATLESTLPSFTKDIATEIEEYRQLADAGTHRTVISQPGVVRIGVKRDGFYRVTRAQLAGAGFDVNSDPNLWRLYVEGVEQAIIVGDGANYIEFYGKALDQRETDIRRYYLVNNLGPGKRMQSRVSRSNTSTVTSPSYLQTFVKKERIQYVEDIYNGDAENYFGRGIGSSPTAAAMTFNLSGVDFSQPDSTMQLRFQGYSDGYHLVEVILNDVILASTSGAGQDSFVGHYLIPTSLLREGSNSIKFRAMGQTGDFVFFDALSIGFNRNYLADQNKLNFYTQNYRIARLDGFTSTNVRVFDMTRDGDPVLMTNLNVQQNGATFGVNMPAARGRSFYAVEDSAILAAESVTPNNPELLGIPSNAADLVIISYKDFMTQADAWAEYRRNQGFTVKVIEVSEIYDEFNYGALSSNSIKDFLEYASTNWQTPPRYVLLIGDASWDSRNYENVGFFNYVPSLMVQTIYLETASDEALADFDNDGLAEMAIGRISVRTVTDANTVFDKTRNWEAALTGASLDRGALFAHDYNNTYDFAGMSINLRNQLSPTTPATFVYRGDANANTTLINEMNTGKFIINYAGHGSAGSWGGNPLFFNVFSVPTTANHDPAIYTMLTCLNGYFHWLYNPSISEVLMNAQNKGAVAAWASSGLTTPNVQQEMARRFYFKLAEGNLQRMGDLVRDAKTALVFPYDSPDVRRSWVLIGDPMLKVR